MNREAVNGAKNGQFYNLPAGDIKVSGSMGPDVKGISKAPITVNASVWRERIGPDQKIGSKNVKPPANLHKETSFSISSSNRAKGDYYLRFEKSEDDGWDLRGSGSIKSTYWLKD